MSIIKKVSFTLLPLSAFALSPFDTPKEVHFNLSAFNTKTTTENKQVVKNQKVTCRYVCDKKIYKEQKIADAISFYKKETK